MEPLIRTHSRIQMWYLRLFRGLRVQCRLMRPYFIIGGVVLYHSTWVLSTSH